MRIQSFTRYLEENDPGYEKLKSKRFRKVRFNEAEQAIMNDEELAAISGVSLYIEENPDMYDESYYKAFSGIKDTRYVDSLDDQGFELFYSFSGNIRGDRRYGNANWSARFLYEFLCQRFNGGERFVDTYFNRVFPYRPVYATLKDMVDEVKTNILLRWNDGDLKGGQWSAFYRFQDQQMARLKRLLELFSHEIREDIILCLGTGMVPLQFSLSKATTDKRLSLGLPGDTPFYATSWLISQIEVHVILSGSDDGTLFYSDNYKGGE